jgi:hypothetical protein
MLPTTGGTPYYILPEFTAQSDVWALGVTMLYVRKIPFPDGHARQQHPKPLHWIIADLNQPASAIRSLPTGRSAMSAMEKMRIWLGEISETRGRFHPRGKLEWLISEMLVPNPNQRIMMARLTQELCAEQPPTNK